MRSGGSLGRLLPATIRGKLLGLLGIGAVILFAGMGLVIAWGLPWDWHHGIYRLQLHQAMQQLSSLANDRRDLLSQWLAERLGDAQAIAAVFRLGLVPPDEVLPPGPSPPALAEGRPGAPPPPLASWLAVLQQAYRCDSVDFISQDSGQILSSSNPILIGDRLTIPASLIGDDPALVFAPGFRAGHSSFLLILQPLAAAKALVFRFTLDDVLAQMQAPDGPLGDSGEVLLVTGDRLLLTQPRHPLPDGSRPRPLVDRLTGPVAEYAAWGIDGLLQTKDYRQQPVLAAVRHLRITAEVGIGVVVKQDEDEILAPARQHILALAVVGSGGLVALLGLVLLLARHLLQPLEAVTGAADRLGAGDLGARAGVTSRDEAGLLANAFNTMAQRIETWNRELEERIQQATGELYWTNQELQQSRTQLQAILDNSRDAIGVLKAGQLVFVNPAYRRLFGYERHEELMGMGFLELLAPEARPQVPQSLAEPGCDGQAAPLLAYETVGRRRDGTSFPMDVQISRYELAGDPLSLVILRDLTDAKQAATERALLQEQLLHLQKLEAIGTLAGGIAHDFNNILASILGFTELAQEGVPPDSPVGRDLEQIEKAGLRARDLVKQLLTFSRKSQVKAEPLRPDLLVKESIKFLRATIPSSITIRSEIEPECGLVLADPTQIHQVLTNLCVNAAQAMEDKGGTLTVGLRAVELEADAPGSRPGQLPGASICLTVTDTGPGIPPKILGRIFDPYFTTKEVGKGSGLGLAIVHGIVQGLGGFIQVDSQPGQGTCFKVFIPRQESAAAEEARAASPAPGRARGEHILLVDDEPSLTRVEGVQLQRQGYRVTSFTDSRQALDAFTATPEAFDLLVTDQTMPGLTGREL
ncbi:MAG: ATP-binding protein, partial [Thermodesulfobacteriota bacterium]